MKLSDWAKQQGISYETAWRWFRDDKLPVPSTQTETGTILVHPETLPEPSKTVLYARVSSHDQKNSLENQIRRMKDFSSAKGWQIDEIVKEIGSGLNDSRSKINRILADPEVKRIVVEHRDRIARFGVEMLQSSLDAQNREIVVMNNEEYEDDTWQDFVDVVTSMCARIYGKRSARLRAEKAKQAVQNED